MNHNQPTEYRTIKVRVPWWFDDDDLLLILNAGMDDYTEELLREGILVDVLEFSVEA